MAMTLGCDFGYAHMHVADMRRLGRPLATLFQRDLVEHARFCKGQC